MAKTRSPEEFRSAVEKKKIHFWFIHQCSFCNYRCGYVFRDGDVFYDSGCDCVTYGYVITPKDYEDVAEQYNMQTHEKFIRDMDEFWGFESQLQLVEEGEA